MDRIMADPRARELAGQPGMPELADLRRRVGATLSDEDFLLRATMPGEQVDAMQAAGPAPRDYDPETRKAMAVLRDLLSKRNDGPVSLNRPGFNLELA
jgi:oxaloacetate decarboxylase alpha subunit